MSLTPIKSQDVEIICPYCTTTQPVAVQASLVDYKILWDCTNELCKKTFMVKVKCSPTIVTKTVAGE